MTVMHKIDNYKIRIWGNDLIGTDTRIADKIIDLFSDSIHVGTAYFVRPGKSLGDSDFSLNTISFIAPEEHYDSVVDLLRNEMPVYMGWEPHSDDTEQNDGNAFFLTAKEPAGEGEVSAPRGPATGVGPTPVIPK